MSKEIFKKIKGFEKYEISNFGRVKSFCWGKERILKNQKDSNGYLYVRPSKNGKLLIKSLHRMVAEAFLKLDKKRLQVNHIDGNKGNNNINNLEWCTPKENNIHAIKIGLHKGIKGENHPKAKLKEKDIIKIRKLYKNYNETYSSIARQFNVARHTINRIINNKTWNHV